MVDKKDVEFNPDKSKAVKTGVLNLLNNALQTGQGETLLIVGEHGPSAHFDEDICENVAKIARDCDLNVEVLLADVGTGADDFPDEVSSAMREVDHTLFFSRLGDQVRFCSTPGRGSKTMCYTPATDYLASPFAQLPYRLSRLVHDRLVETMAASDQFCLMCADGTHLVGKLVDLKATTGDNLADQDSVFTEFTVHPFPLAIFPPVSTSSMSGRLILKRWLTSSSTISYDDSVFRIPKPVTAIVEKGHITKLEGDADVCRSIDRHLRAVADIVGGEPRIINSWHTGILPPTWYKGRAEDDLERWGNVTFCSPRFTHLHACGSDPGHVAISVFDATIRFDEELLWDRGQFVFPFSSNCIDVFDEYPSWLDAYRHNGDIGLPADKV